MRVFPPTHFTIGAGSAAPVSVWNGTLAVSTLRTLMDRDPRLQKTTRNLVGSKVIQQAGSVADPTRIEEVRERVRDFTKALRQAGAEDVARRVDGYAAGFVDGAQVRRSVDAIKQQLRHLRAHPEDLPDLPVVQIAADRLEDACKDALRAGLITPARLSIRAQGRRKLSLVVLTLTAAGFVLGIPLALAMYGVDLQDRLTPRVVPTMTLPKSAAVSVDVNVLVESEQPKLTTKVEFAVAGNCPLELAGGASCRAAGERMFDDEKLNAFEVMRADEAYGVYVAFSDERMIGAVGTGRVHVAAGPETPEGRYTLPLTAAFVGYSPERCNLLQRVQDRCRHAERGPNARHENLPVPSVVVDVVKARPEPNAAEILAAHAAEQRKRAAERAAQIAGAVAEIKAVLDDTQRQIKKRRYDLVKQRIDKLTMLFAPLDAIALAGADAEPLPPEVVTLRARYEAEQRELGQFYDKVFDAAYDALAQKQASESDADVFARVAAKFGIDADLIEQIYADHAQQIEARMAKAAAAKQAAEDAAKDALLRRCGQLPKAAWNEVRAYLQAWAEHERRHARLHECFTPRLDTKTCWSVVCDFDEVEQGEDLTPDHITPRQWTFRMRAGRVVEHIPGDK